MQIGDVGSSAKVDSSRGGEEVIGFEMYFEGRIDKICCDRREKEDLGI